MPSSMKRSSLSEWSGSAYSRALVIEDGLSFFKRDAMFAPVGAVFLLVPDEAQRGHDYIVCISAIRSTAGIRDEPRGVALRVRQPAISSLEWMGWSLAAKLRPIYNLQSAIFNLKCLLVGGAELGGSR